MTLETAKSEPAASDGAANAGGRVAIPFDNTYARLPDRFFRLSW